ncbi:synaptopodin isoform X2 [Xiphophorus maculatus]|uniref:synaptopodin isoform X2 n=1 Tax=Xiphophorus maculatus TaxID=8083 RepID=UPI000C6D22EC|nr:synaptopodin isoform X2 [Xiphophorus maculatus]XP_023184352.1 synaptopodin isoform X2 [Xiphophorus maculatus]XP_023184353.1 synaptopodin isoform X2 [Xiphophorus maculatus]
MEKGHTSIRRGVSWSPGGLRKPIESKQEMQPTETDYNASWEKTGFSKQHISRKTNLSRSASLSEKELKEARLKSHIIAAQLTIPSNSGSSSRGVQLFNRRKQRVNAFTLESCGQGSEVDKTENVKSDSLSNKQTWAERSCEDKDTDLNLNNNKLHFLPPASNPSTGGIMDEENKNFIKDEDTENYDIQERHFLPVKEEPEEEDDIKDKIHEVLEDDARHQTPLGSNDSHPAVMAHVERKTETNEGHPAVVPSEKLLNGCHSTSGSERISLVSPSKQTPAFLNRTARPFFSPPTVLSPDSVSPATDIPPPPSYATPPLPSSTQPVTFSPPPPPPSYPTPPLPAFTNQPPQTFYSGPLPMSPPMSSPCLSPSNFPVSQHPPAPHCGPLTAPKPSIFVPQSTGERKLITPIKTGILEEGAARRANKKSMFTFKEKPVVAPNPELLSLVQGADERKKHGHRSVPEPAPEEELLALGAEASNFLAKAEEKTTGARAPEWASCLKSSKTRPRLDHRPEQSLTNVSGKGAELFAKRQSRMEKYVVENQNPGQIRSPSPTMSLPPSWVYPSNMPGRVKAIAKNSEVSAQISQNLKAQQAVKQKPKPKVAVPEPVPEPPTTLENGCSKIEMDLARHRPYQLNSSLFVFNPVKDPISTLPRGAPQAKNLLSSQSFSRHTSLPNTSPSYYGSMSPQLPLTSPRGSEYPANPASPHARITSLMSPFSPERVSSPRSGVQAPKPTFSAKKAGITPQESEESSPVEITGETSRATSTPSLTRRFSSPANQATRKWISSSQTSQSPTTTSGSICSVKSPVNLSSNARSQSFMSSQNSQFSSVNSTSASRPSQAATVTSPCSPPWGSRCQSPAVSQSSTTTSIPFSKPSENAKTHYPISPPWGSRCQSPSVSNNNKTSSASAFSMSRPSITSVATSTISPPWGSRCQSPAVSQNTQSSTFSPGPTCRPSQTPPWGSRCQSPSVSQNNQSSAVSVSPSRPLQIFTATSPVCPPWSPRSQSPALFQSSSSFQSTNPLHTTATASSPRQQKDNRCTSQIVNNLDSKANHRLLAKNIINAAKRKNSPSPGALSSHGLPISPVGNFQNDWQKPPISPFQQRSLGAQSPTFTSPPVTPTQRICSPVRLYNTRSLTDSDASVESEDSGLRSPGLHSYNTCPRGWGGSLRVKRSTVSTDL